jgi:hypothetical protein
VARKHYRYAPVRHVWRGVERNIGVVVHDPKSGFFRLSVMGRGDLVRRLPDVPREDIERLEAQLAQWAAIGREGAERPGLLERLASEAGIVRLGAIHEGTTADLNWAVFHHYSDFAHPEIAEIG